MTWCYNPCIKSGTSNLNSFQMMLKSGTTTLSWYVSVYNGKWKIDLSPFLCRMFTDPEVSHIMNIEWYVNGTLKETLSNVVCGFRPVLWQPKTTKLNYRWFTHYENYMNPRFVKVDHFEDDDEVNKVLDDSTEGLFVEWQDNLAQKFQFLFKEGTETITTTDKDVVDKTEEICHYQKVKEKGIEHTVKCCAENLTEDEFWYVQGIATSVIVNLYDKDEEDICYPIRVKAGSFSHTKKDGLYRVEVIFILPPEKSIRL